MLHGRFFADKLGKPIREWMFKSAAELDPDADLFINDFDVVENGQLTEVSYFLMLITLWTCKAITSCQVYPFLMIY